MKKKIFLGIFILLMCFTLIGCGNTEEEVVDDIDYTEEEEYYEYPEGEYDYEDYYEEGYYVDNE